MEIRLATVSDIPALLEIENECFHKPWGEKDLIYEINDNPVSVVNVLEENNVIVGFISYWITFDSATIAQIAIRKNHQGRGLAKELMQDMVDDCYAKRVINITLEVRASNIKAINLYNKFGFKQIVIKPHYYENGEDAIYMVRKESI